MISTQKLYLHYKPMTPPISRAFITPDAEPRPARPWRQVAEEATRESDPVRLKQLMFELNQALEDDGLIIYDSPPMPV